MSLLVIVGFGAVVSGCSDDDSNTTVITSSVDDDSLRQTASAAGAAAVSKPAAENTDLVELGRALFFDKELSGNRNISCATCHHPTAGTGDNLPLSLGEGATGQAQLRTTTGTGQVIPRNAPDIFNDGVQGMDTFFWDSRVRRDPATGVLTTPEPALNGSSPARADLVGQLTSALAAQAMFPVTSNDEMRGQPGDNELADATTNQEIWSRLMTRLVGTNNGTVGGIAGYRTLFRAAYPSVTNYDNLTFAHAARAIAAFEREVWTAVDTPWDRYLAGDDTALSTEQKAGAQLFYGAARCSECHSGPLLTDFQHHALAVPQLGPGKAGEPDDRGLALESGNTADNYKFRTPALRNVALTAPYFHSGAYETLEDVIRHHLNPGGSLLAYNASKLPTSTFQNELDTDAARNQARVAAVTHQALTSPPGLSDTQIRQLIAFLHALTDPGSLNLLNDAPSSVPSGLSLGD